MSLLLDTNVMSELRKGERANSGVREWVTSVEDAELYISVLVVGEIRQGIERLRGRDPAQASVLDSWLNMIQTDYRERTIGVTAHIAEEWGRMNAFDRLPTVDGLLAATARVERLTLVTRNTKDVERTGIEVLNPFS